MNVNTLAIAVSDRARVGRDGVVAIVLTVLGGLVIWWSLDLRAGTLARMGPGYFPLVLGGLMVATGIGLKVRDHIADALGLRDWDMRGLVLVPLGMALFGVALPFLGLVATSLLVVAVARLALPGGRPAEIAALATVLSGLVYAIFIAGLGLTLPTLPSVI